MKYIVYIFLLFPKLIIYLTKLTFLKLFLVYPYT